jgi:hypothetical protein
MIVGLTPDRPTGPTSQPARIGGLGLVLLLLCVALSSPASLAASRPSALVKIAGTPGEFEGLQDVACPSVTQCTAVGGSVEATFNPRRPGHPLATRIADGGRLETVACPLATQCTTLVAHDRELTFNPRTPAGAVSVALGGRDFSADVPVGHAVHGLRDRVGRLPADQAVFLRACGDPAHRDVG